MFTVTHRAAAHINYFSKYSIKKKKKIHQRLTEGNNTDHGGGGGNSSDSFDTLR